MSTFEEKAAKSPMAHDVKRLVELSEKLAHMLKGADHFVMDAEVTIGSPDGYVIGSAWWDPESEVWRVDTTRHGETI